MIQPGEAEKQREVFKRNNSPPRREPSEGKIPVRSQQQDRETKKSRGVVVGGDVLGEVGSSASEGGLGVGVAEAVDVIIKKDLVRAHVVALKDCCENVVVRVEAIGTPEGVDRKSRGRKSTTRADVATGGVRARGRTRARRTRRLATCVTATRASVVANRRVTEWVSAKARGGRE